MQDYPANTVRGRICLGLRLDWDKDPGQVFSKETSDIYIKVEFVKYILQFNSRQDPSAMRVQHRKLIEKLTKIRRSKNKKKLNKNLPANSSK